MKKTILFFIAILFGVSLAGQSGGDGKTAGTAYYGTISTPTTWTYAYNSGTIYVGQTGGNEDLTIGTGGSLTIEAGVTVKFCTTASDLKITGTGILTAIGTSSSLITFTKNVQATWGHISFEASTGNSIIKYCIIEYGYKNGSGIEGYGGGIHTNTNSLSITNCIIRNNYALWGGAVFVNQNRNPSISNCYIYNNRSGDAGGGFYFWNGAKSVVSNCIFDSNHCLEPSVPYYSGGGIAAQSNTSLKILNCTFVNNTSTQPSGKSIMLYSSAGDLIMNCIVWSNTNTGTQFYVSGTYTIQNTAVIGSAPTGTGNFVLSTNNTDPTGPNFTNPAAADWSINFISPCRDKGTVPSPAVPNDYAGNPRIGPYDIGAYEVQYSRWTGATSTGWGTASNWAVNMLPTTLSNVVIPSATNNPLISADETVAYLITESGGILTVGANSLLSATNLKNGGSLILNPNGKATIATIVNNGVLKLGSDATGISSLITNSFSGSDATIEIFLTGGNPGAPTLKLNKWHFISTPVPLLPVSTFAPAFTLNVAGWYDNQVSGTLATGWIAYDGYRYSTGVTDGPTFSNLTPGSGYDYYAATDQKYTFAGQLNTSNVPMSLSFSVNDAVHGFNLLGNPFSSGLNWDDIVNSLYFPYPVSASKSLYFTRNNAQCSYIGGVGIPADVTGIIPPMQGFFVKTYSAGNTITIPAGARTQGNIHARYKGLEVIPLVRLSLAEGTLTDETVVRFDAAAKSGSDNDFDAPKMFLSPDILSIYTVSDGSNFAINGQPFPAPSVEIPVVVNLLTAGSNTISATQLEGLDNYDVSLRDNITGIITDLKSTPVVTFSALTGTIADRFILKIGTITTGIEDPVISKNTFNIYPANSMINIRTISDQWDGKTGSVRVLDLTGKVVSDQDNSEFSKNSLIQIAAPEAKGIYMVEVKTGVLRFVGKVVIR